MGLGLALWKGVERYEDVKFIANNLNRQLITALNNADGNDCNGFYDSITSCDAQLVKMNTSTIVNPVSTYEFNFQIWKQTLNGSNEIFAHLQAYGR